MGAEYGLTSCRLRPQRVKRCGQRDDYLCRLFWIEPFSEKIENGFHDAERIARELRRQTGGDTRQKFVQMTNRVGLRTQVPACILNAAHKNRKLRGKMYRLFCRETVAQGEDHGLQRAVRLMPVAQMVLLDEFHQPKIDLLNRMIEYRKVVARYPPFLYSLAVCRIQNWHSRCHSRPKSFRVSVLDCSSIFRCASVRLLPARLM